jgi:hypothetical protein
MKLQRMVRSRLLTMGGAMALAVMMIAGCS